MDFIKLLEDDAKLKAIKWVGKVLWNIIKPYMSPVIEHPKLFPLHVMLFLSFYSVRTWLNDRDWTEKFGIKKLTKDAKEQMFNVLVLLVVAIVLERNKGKLEPLKAYSLSDFGESVNPV